MENVSSLLGSNAVYMRSDNDSSKSTKSKNDFLAGAFAGGMARFIVAPLDVLKIRLQLQTATGAARKYPSILSALRTILREEGVRAFWKGNLTAMLMIAPYSATTLTVNQLLKKWWLGQNTSPSPLVSSLSGAAAGVAGTLVIYPLDLVRTRLAAQKGSQGYSSLAMAFKDVCSGARGWRGMYTGLGSALVGIVPYMGVQFALYDATRAALARQQHAVEAACDAISRAVLRTGAGTGSAGEAVAMGVCRLLGLSHWSNKYLRGSVIDADKLAVGQVIPPVAVVHTSRIGELPGWVAPVAGLVAGAGGKAVSFPFDVLKKRFQVLTFRHNIYAQEGLAAHTGAAPSIWRMFRDIVSREGVLALYKGVAPAVLKTGAAGSLTFGFYEAGLRTLSTLERTDALKLL